MIDEYDRNYFLLSCDICGVTEAGPFESFYDAVQYKKDNKKEWICWRMKDERSGRHEWKDVCNNPKCREAIGVKNWKSIPISNRPKIVDRSDDISHREPALVTKRLTNPGLADIAAQIGDSIRGKAQNKP